MSSALLLRLPENLATNVLIDPLGSRTSIEHRNTTRHRVLKHGSLKVVVSPRLIQVHDEELPSRIEGGVLVKDLSSTGIGFLYHQQLYPCEVIEVQLKGHHINATVVRCCYLGPSCYEHGAQVNWAQKIDSTQ